MLKRHRKQSDELQQQANEAWLEASLCDHGEFDWKSSRDAKKACEYAEKARGLEDQARLAREEE